MGSLFKASWQNGYVLINRWFFTGPRLSGAGLGLWQTALKAFHIIFRQFLAWSSSSISTWHMVVGKFELWHLLLTVLLSRLLGQQGGEWSTGRHMIRFWYRYKIIVLSQELFSFSSGWLWKNCWPGCRAVQPVASAAAEKSRSLLPDLLVQDEDDRGDDGRVQEAHPDEHCLVDVSLRHLRHLPVTGVV